mmetsp:Transcript_6817/g.9422  ORF Transcript_6817/g.9422 Transcript_6817/m.9422 type:complete len:219 (-) Transcript_6817:52-708(-)
MTFRPSFLSRFAIFAMVVVFPAPFTPTTSRTQIFSSLGSRGTCTLSRMFLIFWRSTSRSVSASVSPLATMSRIGSSNTVVVEIPTSAIKSCSSSSSMVSSSTSPVISRLNCCCSAFRLLLRDFERDSTMPFSASIRKSRAGALFRPIRLQGLDDMDRRTDGWKEELRALLVERRPSGEPTRRAPCEAKTIAPTAINNTHQHVALVRIIAENGRDAGRI